MQRATGYTATILKGEITHRDGDPTSKLPGSLVRGARAAPVLDDGGPGPRGLAPPRATAASTFCAPSLGEARRAPVIGAAPSSIASYFAPR